MGIGSRGHVDEFIDMTNFKISSELAVARFEKSDDKFVGWNSVLEWFVYLSIITDTSNVPVFTFITVIIYQNFTSVTLLCFIQPRAVVCVSYAHAAVGYFEPPFSLQNSYIMRMREVLFI